MTLERGLERGMDGHGSLRGQPVHRGARCTRLVATMAAVALLATAAALLGIGVRSTVGGQAAVDEPQYLLSALSLWNDGDLDIADELAVGAQQPFHSAPLPVQTEVRADGSQVSPHDPLLPLLLAVPMGLVGWVAAKATLAVLAGLLAALTTWVGVVRFGTPLGLTGVVVAVAGATAPLSVYGQQVYPELPAALAVVGAVAVLTGRLQPLGAVGLIASVAALPWLSVKYVIVAVVLAALGLARLWGSGRRAAASWVGGALAALGVAFLGAHQWIYGGWTAYASGDHFQDSGEFGVVGFAPDYLGRSTRLVGLLTDRDFGLLAWQPAWLLAVPALAALLSARPRHWLVVAAPLAAGWLVATFVALTMHGYWWPGRQVVVVLPLAVLAIVWWLHSLAGPARRVIFAGAGVLAAVGLAVYARLLVGGWSGALHWVNVPDGTGQALTTARGLLPDYREDGASTWVLHALWVVLLGALTVAGWWTARPRPGAGGRTTAIAAQREAVPVR